jgi:hypothetical protein
MPTLSVTSDEFNAINKLSKACELPGDPPGNFDTAYWVTGLATVLGMTVEELREHAGSFPPGDMVKLQVVQVTVLAARWS